ncbi:MULTISPECIES: hypothetical protein [unclassified Streptomyces]|uniref:hypothetical protein n=1 Tax=unclassified Streptomyces TaxID=2593676 RepID=UPI0008049B71|nr:hypothetical protein [Streptomyces sp. OspMP-M45]MYR71323.1 hypothetical protein [Streptomyces sp. SID4925]SBU98443.1 hypothetical protein YUMDRAFT_06170 [Streptomyces sp. OspMP-M45]
MDGSRGAAFEPSTGDGPPATGPPGVRAGAVRTAFEGMMQIRRLTGAGPEPEGVPAAWELNRPVRAVALALEAAGVPPSATGPSGERTATGYRVCAGESPGAVRVEWVGPPGSGAAHDEEEALGRCLTVLRRSGWTPLLYRGPRRRRFLEVEPPAGAARAKDGRGL